MSSLSKAFHINPALWLLLKMNARGAIRKLLRNILTLHGAVVSLVVVGYAYAAIVHRDAIITDFAGVLSRHGGIALFVLFLITLSNGFSGRGIYLSNPEVQFVLISPVTRQELLGYHLLKQLQAAILFPSLFALITAPTEYLHVYCRVFTGMLALNGFALAVLSLCQGYPARVLKFLQKLVGAILTSLLVLAIFGALYATFWNRKEAVMAFLDSAALHNSLFPFYWANSLLFHEGATATLTWSAITGVFAFSCFALAFRDLELHSDQYNELREELTEKVEKFNKQGFTLPRIRTFEVRVPTLPLLGGAGPILWRRLQELSRHTPYLLGLLILGAGYDGWFASMILQKAAASGKETVGAGDLNYLSQMIAMMVAFLVASFDFKADTHRLEWLKSLPLQPSRIVVGQALLSSLYVSAFISALALLNYGLLRHYFPQKPISSTYFGFLLLSLPLGTLYILAANALFLLVPTYGAERRSAIGVFQYLCGVALLVGMMVLLFAVINACASLAKAIGGTDPVFFLLATTAFSLLAALTFRIVVWAFNRFDVSKVSR